MDFCQKLSQVLPCDCNCWTVTDFQLFLKFIRLEEYGPQFQSANIDGAAFLELKESDFQNLGVSNLIARCKFMENQGLLLKYNEYINSLDDQDIPQNSVNLPSKSGFLSDSFNLPNKPMMMQTPDQSQMIGEGGGFGFGNIDFFMSGKLDINAASKMNAQEGQSIKFNPNAVEDVVEKDGSYVVLQSHYHVQDYRQEKNVAGGKKDCEEDEDLKTIEYAESRIVPREEIKRQQKFNYLNMPKKDLNKAASPSKNQDIESEIKLQNLSNESLAYAIKEQLRTIGSDASSAHIVLSSPEISPIHCEVLYHDREFLLRDMKSNNGTWLRVTSEKKFEVMPGKVYQMEVGQSIYRFRYNAHEHHLELAQGEKPSHSYELKPDVPLSIGKSPQCVLTIQGDQCLSKVHCGFVRRNERVVLEDCKSLNGTWLKIDWKEGLRLEELMEIRVGNQTQRLKVLSIFIKNEQKPGKKCMVCNEEEVKTILEPCLHVGLCGGCAKTVRVCPECGANIDNIIITG